jgi:hypothetical protein
MVVEEVFVNCYNFNPIRAEHASFNIKKMLVLKSKKGIFKAAYKNTPSRAIWNCGSGPRNTAF